MPGRPRCRPSWRRPSRDANDDDDDRRHRGHRRRPRLLRRCRHQRPVCRQPRRPPGGPGRQTADRGISHRPQREARGADWITLCRQSKPLVAAINGPCIGVGLTMVLPFDQLLAAEGARLSLRFVKMGLVPELASSHFIVTRCGWGAASWLALSGTTVFADEAYRLRLVDRVVPPDTLLDEAVAVARELGSNPGPQVRMIKELLTLNATEGDLAAGATARDRCHPGRLPLARASRGGHGLHGKARAELPPGGRGLLSRPPVRGSPARSWCRR